MSDLLGTRYGEGDDAGEVTMSTIKMTTIGLMGAGEHYEERAYINVLMNLMSKFLKLASLLKFTGTITTSATFHALLNILQSHPDIQDKIYQEVVREVGTNRLVRLDDKERLPYTRAVIYETLRFTSIAPFGIPHRTLEDTQLSGIHVPRGTQVEENALIILCCLREVSDTAFSCTQSLDCYIDGVQR